MKTKLFIVLALVFWAGTSCEKKIDLAKEQEAIKAVFEADRGTYFKQDYVGVGDCWIKEPSTTKIWLNGKEETRIVGWDNIDASHKKEAEDNSWDRKQTTAKFSNYQIDMMGNSAWVYCETNWKVK